MALLYLLLFELLGYASGDILCSDDHLLLNCNGASHFVHFVHTSDGLACDANSTLFSIEAVLAVSFCCISSSCPGRFARDSSTRALLQGTGASGTVTTTSAASAAAIASSISALNGVATTVGSNATNIYCDTSASAAAQYSSTLPTGGAALVIVGASAAFQATPIAIALFSLTVNLFQIVPLISVSCVPLCTRVNYIGRGVGIVLFYQWTILGSPARCENGEEVAATGACSGLLDSECQFLNMITSETILGLFVVLCSFFSSYVKLPICYRRRPKHEILVGSWTVLDRAIVAAILFFEITYIPSISLSSGVIFRADGYAQSSSSILVVAACFFFVYFGVALFVGVWVILFGVYYCRAVATDNSVFAAPVWYLSNLIHEFGPVYAAAATGTVSRFQAWKRWLPSSVLLYGREEGEYFGGQRSSVVRRCGSLFADIRPDVLWFHGSFILLWTFAAVILGVGTETETSNYIDGWCVTRFVFAVGFSSLQFILFLIFRPLLADCNVWAIGYFLEFVYAILTLAAYLVHESATVTSITTSSDICGAGYTTANSQAQVTMWKNSIDIACWAIAVCLTIVLLLWQIATKITWCMRTFHDMHPATSGKRFKNHNTESWDPATSQWDGRISLPVLSGVRVKSLPHFPPPDFSPPPLKYGFNNTALGVNGRLVSHQLRTSTYVGDWSPSHWPLPHQPPPRSASPPLKSGFNDTGLGENGRLMRGPSPRCSALQPEVPIRSKTFHPGRSPFTSLSVDNSFPLTDEW